MYTFFYRWSFDTYSEGLSTSSNTFSEPQVLYTSSETVGLSGFDAHQDCFCSSSATLGALGHNAHEPLKIVGPAALWIQVLGESNQVLYIKCALIVKLYLNMPLLTAQLVNQL